MRIDTLKWPSVEMKLTFTLITGLLLVLSLSGCATHGQTGALTGALAGAAVGGLIGPDPSSRALNAMIGAGVGMFTGAAVGEQMDRNEMYRRDYYRSQGYKYDPQYGWYKDPYWQSPSGPPQDSVVVEYY